MRHRPDGPYNWIGHYIDHWSKFHVLLFALQRKSSKEVAWNLATKVFAYLGLPKILQSDNGREFASTLMAELVKNWPGEISIVNGRPCHPQSQGLVERGNAKVEEMIACHFHESKGTVIFMKARELSPGQTGYMKFNVSIIIYYISI